MFLLSSLTVFCRKWWPLHSMLSENSRPRNRHTIYENRGDQMYLVCLSYDTANKWEAEFITFLYILASPEGLGLHYISVTLKLPNEGPIILALCFFSFSYCSAYLSTCGEFRWADRCQSLPLEEFCGHIQSSERGDVGWRNWRVRVTSKSMELPTYYPAGRTTEGWRIMCQMERWSPSVDELG
jgi:hypothetical protein